MNQNNNNILENYPLLKDEEDILINLFKRWISYYGKHIEDNSHFTSRDKCYKVIKEGLKKTGNWKRRENKQNNINAKSSINLSKNKNNPINNQDDDDDWGKPVAFEDRYIPKGDPNKILTAQQHNELLELKELGTKHLDYSAEYVNKIWDSLEKDGVYLSGDLHSNVKGFYEWVKYREAEKEKNIIAQEKKKLEEDKKTAEERKLNPHDSRWILLDVLEKYPKKII